MGAARGHAFVGVAIGYEPVCELLLPLLKLEIKKEPTLKLEIKKEGKLKGKVYCEMLLG